MLSTPLKNPHFVPYILVFISKGLCTLIIMCIFSLLFKNSDKISQNSQDCKGICDKKVIAMVYINTKRWLQIILLLYNITCPKLDSSTANWFLPTPTCNRLFSFPFILWFVQAKLNIHLNCLSSSSYGDEFISPLNPGNTVES